MYSSEKLVNFRWISKIMATHSDYTLTTADLASFDLHVELAQLGQFAEVAYGVLPPEFVFDNLDMLSKADFPLEGYDALQSVYLVSSFRGTVANLPAYVAYRSLRRQLVVAISGTSTLKQAVLYDLRAVKTSHPARRGCMVHTGFWRLYQGIKPLILSAIEEGLREHDVDELVVTGHSLGGALSYLVALDLLLLDSNLLPPGLALKVIAFGAPRCGNPKLSQYWSELVNAYRIKYGEDSLREYSVKAYNDGDSHSIIALWNRN